MFLRECVKHDNLAPKSFSNVNLQSRIFVITYHAYLLKYDVNPEVNTVIKSFITKETVGVFDWAFRALRLLT